MPGYNWNRTYMRFTSLLTRLVLVLTVTLGSVACVVQSAGSTPTPQGRGEAEPTRIAVLDIGQGLSVAVITPDGHGLLYDAGNGTSDVEDVILPFLRQHGITRLDYIVTSHPDQDHVGGMPAMLEAVDVETWVDPVVPTTNQAYLRALQVIDRKGVHTQRARQGDELKLGDRVTVEILWPDDPLMTDSDGEPKDNDNSVVLRITDGDVRVLLTGDIELPAEEALLELDHDLLQADVLQVAHHGSQSSTSDAFLDAVGPTDAIISVGADNQYGHPHEEVIQRLRRHGVAIFRTDVDGTVVVETDGQHYWLEHNGGMP